MTPRGLAGPGATIVVATRNRAHLLGRLFNNLQQLSGDIDWNAIVVNDGSDDETREVLERLTSEHEWARAIHLQDNAGPATARNVGWRAAAGEVIVFTDDDCRVDPGWLTAMVDGVARGADVVQGQIVPDSDSVATIGPFGRTINPVTELNPFFATCNVAYRRDVLEEMGGFDEDFPHPWCEDVDLGQRAVAAGARVAFEPAALVTHDVVPQGFAALLRDRRRRESDALLIRKHPHMRQQLGGIDAHVPALATGGGFAGATLLPVAAGTRWLVAALAAIPYLRHHVSRRERPPGVGAVRWALAAPPLWVADLYEAARFHRAQWRLRR